MEKVDVKVEEKKLKGICPYCKKSFKYIVLKFGKTNKKFPQYNCDCHDEIVGKRIKKKNHSKIKYLYEHCKIDKLFIESEFKVHDKILFPYMDINYLVNGVLLIIFGNPGNHKTGQVVAICKMAMDQLKTVLYFRTSRVPGLTFIHRDYYEKMIRCDILVLDNFGKENVEKSGGVVFDIIDYRVHNKKTTILITNVNPEDVSEIFDSPLISRLLMFTKIKIDGEDKRKELNDSIKKT